MTISKVNAPTWSVGEKLTAAQINAIDTNVTYAVDKRAGQTDSIGSALTVASGGSVTIASGASIVAQPGSTVTGFPVIAADLTALAAIAAPADGTVRLVPALGVYTFKTTATTGLTPFRVAAGDATPGGWLSGTAYQTSLVRLCHPSLLPIFGAIAASPVLDLTGVPCNATDYAFRGGACVFSTVVTGSAIGLGAAVSLDPVLVDGATLTLVRLRWKANPSHAALPLLMPKYGVARVDTSQNVTALLSTGSGLAVDASATFGAYNVEHWNTFTPDQNNVVDKTTYGYFLALFNEGHTNSFANSGCYSIEVTQTITDARRS